MRTPLRCGMEYPRYSRRKRIDEPGSPVREGGVVHVWTGSGREDHGKTFSPIGFPCLPSFLSSFLSSSCSSFPPFFLPFSPPFSFGLLTTSRPWSQLCIHPLSIPLSLPPSSAFNRKIKTSRKPAILFQVKADRRTERKPRSIRLRS